MSEEIYYLNKLQNNIVRQDKKLKIAIEGLNAIIFEGSDNLNIAKKTLKEIKECNNKSTAE